MMPNKFAVIITLHSVTANLLDHKFQFTGSQCVIFALLSRVIHRQKRQTLCYSTEIIISQEIQEQAKILTLPTLL